MGRSITIVREAKDRFGSLIARVRADGEAPAAGEPIADGGSASASTTVPQRRANAWAGVYAAAFGVEGGDGDTDPDSAANADR